GTLQLSGGTLNTAVSRSPSTAGVFNAIDVTADSAIPTTSTAATVDLNLGSNSVSGAAGSTLTFRNDAGSGSGVFQPRLSGGGFTFTGTTAIVTGACGSM